MTALGDDFGGLVGLWAELEGLDEVPRIIIGRVRHGKLIESLLLDPVNSLQMKRTLDALIDEGRQRGLITAEHVAQATELATEHIAKDEVSDDEINRMMGQ